MEDSQKVYVGIYTYTAPPNGEPLGTFLEAYPLGEEDKPRVSIRFEPPSLSAEHLDAVLEAFVAAIAQGT